MLIREVGMRCKLIHLMLWLILLLLLSGLGSCLSIVVKGAPQAQGAQKKEMVAFEASRRATSARRAPWCASVCLFAAPWCASVRLRRAPRLAPCASGDGSPNRLGAPFAFNNYVFKVPIAIKASVTDDGYKQCEHAVNKWASSSSSTDSSVKGDKHALRDLLFFLHVPRTGGRTYFYCFLKKLYLNSQECPRSYDKLRFNPRKTNCRLLSTHDDYSMMSKLPKEKTSMVTILRNPIDRVFSTYEFSVEVAARFLIHPNLTSVARMAKRVRRKTAGISTLDIWPWKHLVPWMREDLFARRDFIFLDEKEDLRDTRKLRGQSHLVTNNSYDMEDFLMPLHEYIHDPIARDLVHNGATFQVLRCSKLSGMVISEIDMISKTVCFTNCVIDAGDTVFPFKKKNSEYSTNAYLFIVFLTKITGLTNNSYYAEAYEVRHCVSKYRFLGKYVLGVAKRKLDDMLYVGLTENHKESASMFANIVGAQVISQHTVPGSSTDVAADNDSEQDSLLPDIKSDVNDHGNNTNQTLKNLSSTNKEEAARGNFTVPTLMETYESCSSDLRSSQAARRVNSLKRISPANFTKEARLQVPEVLIQEIASLNSLDVELYNYARQIFTKQHAHMMQSIANAVS
ncbi:hypothetical protein OROMI_015176 [Orobanche minor]